jgi:hypothetical protein
MKTFFVELVFNNKGRNPFESLYLGGIISANDKEDAEMIVLRHYIKYYTGGDKGEYHVQCNWEVKIPTREIIEAHWRKASGAQMPMGVHDSEGHTIGYRYHQAEKTKKEVMANWDYCHCNWANPTVHYDIDRVGYSVSIHNYMCMPCELMFFKGVTRNTYLKARKFVKDNTFKGTHFRKRTLGNLEIS